MLGPRASAPATVVLLLTLGLAGCAGNDSDLDPAEAPQGPDSLRVGVVQADEYSRILTETVGQRVVIDLESWSGQGAPPRRVEPFEDTEYRERWVTVGHTDLDSFLQPVDVAWFRTRITDLDPEETESLERESTAAYTLWNRTLVYSDYNFFVFAGGECTLLDLLTCQPAASYKPVDARAYGRPIQNGSWGLLEGQILRLGEVVSFRQDFALGTSRFAVFLNFTPLREEYLGELRTFVVEQTFEVVDLTSTLGAARPDASEDAVPLPVRLLWMSSRHGLPAKEFIASPFVWNGESYWRNTTSWVERYEGATGPVVWGSGSAPARPERLPGAEVVPPRGYVALAQTSGLTYPLEEAWGTIEADLTLQDFQDFMAQHPTAWPYGALYRPDPGRGTFTWTFLVGDEMTNPFQGGTPLVVSTRRQYVAEAADVYLLQNDVTSDTAFFPGYGYWDERVDTMDVVSVGDAWATFERVRTFEGEPAIALQMWSYGVKPMTIHFFEPELLFREPVLPSRDVWGSGRSVELSITDGGLVGFNTTIFLDDDEWPWTVPPSAPPLGLALSASELVGPFPGLYAAATGVGTAS